MKKVLLICIAVLLIAGSIFAITRLNMNTETIVPEPVKHEPINTTEQEKSKEINLYYANKKYIETGDERLIKVIPVKKKVNYDKISLAEAAVRELMKKPVDANLDTEIPDGAQLLGVTIKDGMAIVDFASEGLNGSSTEEMLTINQIVSTLLDIDGINSVQFLKDGLPADDLMGHADTSEPFYKNKDIKLDELRLGEMTLNMKKDEFVKKFGEPTSSSSNGLKTNSSDNVEYFDYHDFKVTITNGEVSEISTISDKYVTPSGLKVGDSRKLAMNTYGEPSSIYRGVLNYKVGGQDELLHIKIKDEKVSEIRIGLEIN